MIRRVSHTPAIEMVVMGASLGGPAALLHVLGRLPAGLPVPIVVVQHMPRATLPLFVEHLGDHVPSLVRALESEEELSPGHVYVATARGQWGIRRVGQAYAATIVGHEPVHACLPAADPLFLTAARAVGRGCLGVVLTGMGEDGARGAFAIRAAGGHVVVQDERSSVVWGMPGAVVRRGAADEVLPLTAIAERIRALVGPARV